LDVQITACIYDYVFILKLYFLFSDIGTEAVQTGAAAPPDPARSIPAAPKNPPAPAAKQPTSKQRPSPPWQTQSSPVPAPDPTGPWPKHPNSAEPKQTFPVKACPARKAASEPAPPAANVPKQPAGPPPTWSKPKDPLLLNSNAVF
jgi:hypothetical protein